MLNPFACEAETLDLLKRGRSLTGKAAAKQGWWIYPQQIPLLKDPQAFRSNKTG